MDLFIFVLTVFLLLLLVRFFFGGKSRSDLPPGPMGVPVLGYFPFMTPRRYVALANVSRRYGDVMMVPFFTTKCLILSSFDAIQKAFIDQGDVFSGRPHFRFIDAFIEDSGIVCTDGEKWKEHRRFALRSLRDFGFGKSHSLNAIHSEVYSFISYVEEKGKQPIDTVGLFSKMTANVICSLVFGDRVASEDQEFPKAKQVLDELLACDSKLYENIPLYFPWLMDIPFFLPLFNQFAVREKMMRKLISYIQAKVGERAANIHSVTEPKDFTDAILLHKMGLETQGEDNHTFDLRSIAGDIVDLFAAGTDTTAVTLSWACLLLALHPDVAAKARNEVREVLGTERLATMQDRPRLNYTLAVLDEVARFASIAPTALIHRTTCDTHLKGFFIPVDTPVMANIFAVHMDPQVWDNPKEFDPNHFLDENGTYTPSSNLIPFSLGKRACPGESLARMELLVFLVSVLQRYDCVLDTEPDMDIKELLMGQNGLVRHLNKHGIIFNPID